jgi:hypothetical protein
LPVSPGESDSERMDQDLIQQHQASYRDPSGFVFTRNGELYRQVNKVYQKDFEHFIGSGLYQELTDAGLLIKHQQIDQNFTGTENWHTTLKPEKLLYISYPYEWCFEQLKDAALLTLQLAETGLRYDMILKDATPYNVQLHKSKLVLIDSLSFEIYKEEQPWVAYRQFCESFLVSLALMHFHQQPLQRLLYSYPDGIPLEIANRLLPWRSRLNLHAYLHIHLQNKIAQKKASSDSTVSFSRQKLVNLLRSLKTLVASFKLERKGVWSDYYSEAENRSGYLANKKSVVTEWVNSLSNIASSIDLGANDGTFSEILSAGIIRTISVDGDHFAISKLYHSIKGSKKDIHPLLMDLSNPSGSTGFLNERASFVNRTQTDLVLVLALIHHLAIGKNIPFERIASFLKELGRNLIIEFIPKNDEKVQLMLSQRKDIFEWYQEQSFVNAFGQYFIIKESKKLLPSDRTLYLMEAF